MNKPAKIAVVGAGYVGLTTAACLAKLGHEVLAIDVDEAKVSRLQGGRVAIIEPDLELLVQAGLSAGNLNFSAGNAQIGDYKIIFLCLPTPPGADGAADTSLLMTAVQAFAADFTPNAIIVNKSTVPVGTAEKVAAAIGRDDVVVVSNPEFLREGSAVHDFLHPDRVVVGGPHRAAEVVANIYRPLGAPIIQTTARTAELMKYGANAYLAMKLSFANAMASLSEELGADGPEVLAGIGADTRIGPSFLRPGPGWGGSCFPKDTLALLAMADDAGYNFDLLREVVRTNDDQTERVILAVTKLVGGSLKGKRLAVWGLSFKAGTGDTRQSPAIRVVELLQAAGANVTAFDPAVTDAPKNVTLADNALAACTDADALVVLTEWPDFAKVKPSEIIAALKIPTIADARGILDAPALHVAGAEVWQIGRGHLNEYQADFRN